MKLLTSKAVSLLRRRRMRQFMENLNRATERRNRQTGLLDRYSGRAGGTAGLLGAIGTNR